MKSRGGEGGGRGRPGDEVSPKCDNLQSPLTSILPGPGLMSSQPMERNTGPPSSPLHHCSNHCCCSFDLIPLTSADLSKRGKLCWLARWMVGWMEAYYPSSSALNYLNANEREGKDNDEGGGSGKVFCRQDRRGGLICCCRGSVDAVWLF